MREGLIMMDHQFDRPIYADTPIIIISRDRLSYLTCLISWLQKAGHNNIIICDNQSTYPLMLDFLKNTKHKVYYSDINSHLAPWETGLVDEHCAGQNYVVTDCDVIPTEECPSNVIGFFSKALEEFKDINKVGLSLKIDDLPECYINKDKVQRWEGQFWRYKRSEQFFQAQLDTTFALYRAGTGHDLNNALRAAPPYSARHLPWYSNSTEPTEEEEYYFTHASKSIATWTNKPVKQDHII